MPYRNGWCQKKISVAVGLSKETHQVVSSLGTPIIESRAAFPPGDLRQNLLRVAQQAMMQYKKTLPLKLTKAYSMLRSKRLK